MEENQQEIPVPSIEIRFNPNTLISFRRFFFLFRSPISSDNLVLYINSDNENQPLLIFSSPLSRTDNFSYFKVTEEDVFKDFVVNVKEILLEIPNANLFSRFMRSISDKVTYFSLQYAGNQLTLVYIEGSEFRTRTISEVKELDFNSFELYYPLKTQFQMEISAKEIVKICESFQRGSGSELLLAINRTPNDYEIRLEVKQMDEMSISLKTTAGELENPMTFKFVFDKSRARLLSAIANIDYCAVMGVTQKQEVFIGHDVVDQNGKELYQMRFKVPFLNEMEENEGEMEIEESMKKQRNGTEVQKKQKEMNQIEEGEEDKEENETLYEKIKKEVESQVEFNKKQSNIY